MSITSVTGAIKFLSKRFFVYVCNVKHVIRFTLVVMCQSNGNNNRYR